MQKGDNIMNLQTASPEEIRSSIRQGALTRPTSGMAKGYVQANVVILPSKYAYDFLKFCFKNPKTCPLLDVSEVGSPSFSKYGKEADIRTDVGLYRLYKDGKFVQEYEDIKALYTDEW